MDATAHKQDFSFGPEPRDNAALSALACRMLEALARVQAGARRSRAVSVHLDFLTPGSEGALTGQAALTKSTASVLFLSAELRQGDEAVLRATALYGLIED